MTSPEGAGAARRGGRRAGLLATACLVALAPVKFSLPAVLHHLDTWPRGIGEWLFMSWPSAIFLGLLVLCLGLAAWEVRGIGVPLRPLAPAAGFFLAQGFSALFTVDRPLSGAVMALFASLLAGYALGLALVREERDLRWVLAGWVAGACAVAWSGVGQATGGLEETRKFLEAHPEMGAGVPELWDRVSRGRVFATFVYPNALGGYVATTVFLVAAWVAAGHGREIPRFARNDRAEARNEGGEERTDSARAAPPTGDRAQGQGKGCYHPERSEGVFSVRDVSASFPRRLRLAVGALLALALLYCLWKSQSKGGYATLVAVALVLAAAGGLRRRLAMALVAGILLLGAAGFAAGYGQRGVEKGKRTLSARVDYWRAAWRIGLDHPVLGSGPGTFAKLYPRYKSWDAESTRLVHNNYLQMWCDSGIAGFAAFAILLPGTLIAWWRRARAVPVRARWAWTLAWAGLVAFAIHSFVDFDLYLVGNAWPAFVLLGALARPAPDLRGAGS